MKLKVLLSTFVTMSFALSAPASAASPLSKLAPHGHATFASTLSRATRVAICEEGGWGPSHDAHGPAYFGNLGWLDSTWISFKYSGDPRHMSSATTQEQARAMGRFAAKYGWPDQTGCTGGY